MRVSFRPDAACDWEDDHPEAEPADTSSNGPVAWFLHKYVWPCFLQGWDDEQDTEDTPERSVAHVAALLNGEEIDEDEVTAKAFKEYLSASPEEMAAIRKRSLNDIIECEMVLQAALPALKRRDESAVEKLRAYASDRFEREALRPTLVTNKASDVETLRRKLAERGFSCDGHRRQWERKAMAQALLQCESMPRLKHVGAREVLDYYRTHADEFHVEKNVQWQDLFVSMAQYPTRDAARTFADKLLDRIRKGEDFVGLSRRHDQGDSSLRPNSEGIGTTPGTILPAQVEDLLFRMRECDAALVEMEHGFHIIKLIKRQETGTRPFDHELQTTIYRKLCVQEYDKEVARIIDQLRRDAVIIVYDTVRKLPQPKQEKPKDSWRTGNDSEKNQELAPWDREMPRTGNDSEKNQKLAPWDREKPRQDDTFSKPVLETKSWPHLNR